MMSASEIAMGMRPMSREELRINVLDYWCGCGCPEAACGALLRLLKLHHRPELANWITARDELDGWLPDAGVRYLLLYQLDHMELTEHGGSVGGAWLTPKGAAVLKGLEREALDDFETLCESYCIHGVSFDPDSTEGLDHDCMNAPEPVKWKYDGPPGATA